MRSVHVLLLGTMIGVPLLSGCGSDGLTPTGRKFRTEAKQRVDTANAHLSYDQAMQAFRVGQFDKALKSISEAIQRNPEQVEYRVLLGRIYLEMHQLEVSKETFATVLELEENNAEAHYYLGVIHQRWSEHDQAASEYLAAFDKDSKRVQYLTAAAESLVTLGRLDEAEAMISEKFDYFEHNAALHQLMGHIAMLRGNAEEAAMHLTNARRLNPDDTALLEELAQTRFTARQYGKCLQAIEQLFMVHDEPRTDLLHMKARSLVELDRTTEARDAYLELSRMERNDESIWIELGMLSWEMGDFKRVAISSAQVMALAPHRYEGYLLRGINERHKGQLDEALDLFKQACEHGQDSALPHMMLGQVYQDLQQSRRAAAAYTRAIRIDPENEMAHALFDNVITSQQGPMATAKEPELMR